MNNETYQITDTDGALLFRTSFFTAEKGSVLHSGIYNRELTSSLAAGALIVLAGFVFAGRLRLTLQHFLGGIGLFVVLSLLFRTLVFRERFLEAVFDKGAGVVKVLTSGVAGLNRTDVYPLERLREIRQREVSFSPENPDGVKVVEHIALQHYTVIPGFGETAVFNTVELVFDGGAAILIFAAREAASALELTERLNKYLER